MRDSKAIAWMMWTLTVAFFAYQFILRLYPGLMMNDIMLKFDIDATDYGYFASMYYYGYAGMQIPIALLLDRYGPKLIVSICAFICAAATLTVIYADQWIIALLGRFLIGAASAVGFLGVSKVTSMWFGSKDYGKMIGLSFALGLTGAVFGGRPVSKLLDIFGWQDVLFYVALASAVLAVLIMVFVRNPNNFESIEDESILNKLKLICINNKILILALASFVLVGPLEGFADVWGVTYLMKAYNITKQDAASLTSFIFIGMIFGSPILTFFAQRYNAYYQFAFFSGIVMAVLFVLLIIAHNYLNYYMIGLMMFIIGICCCYQVLVFTIGSFIMPGALTGVTIAFLNCINMLGGSFFHTAIGRILDYLWVGQMENGVRVYDLSSYSISISIIPLFCLFGSLLFLTISRHKIQ
jgi:predicted MFS family arabinose efflux permease